MNIGTIGHVAHGKSTVVKAISGVQVSLFSNQERRKLCQSSKNYVISIIIHYNYYMYYFDYISQVYRCLSRRKWMIRFSIFQKPPIIHLTHKINLFVDKSSISITCKRKLSLGSLTKTRTNFLFQCRLSVSRTNSSVTLPLSWVMPTLRSTSATARTALVLTATNLMAV
jgi:hypothetical protein